MQEQIVNICFNLKKKTLYIISFILVINYFKFLLFPAINLVIAVN